MINAAQSCCVYSRADGIELIRHPDTERRLPAFFYGTGGAGGRGRIATGFAGIGRRGKNAAGTCVSALAPRRGGLATDSAGNPLRRGGVQDPFRFCSAVRPDRVARRALRSRSVVFRLPQAALPFFLTALLVGGADAGFVDRFILTKDFQTEDRRFSDDVTQKETRAGWAERGRRRL